MANLIYFLLILIIPHEANSISFDFRNIISQNQNTDIVMMGDASINKDGMQMTPDDATQNTAGRGTYVRLLHLWDKNSGELASFSTSFSFVIESRKFADYYADGFAFFLAEENSMITYCGALGLPVDNITYSMLNRFVAVEFDTLWNSEWDPTSLSLNDYHVGIYNNSLNSSQFQKWSINITQGAYCQATVKYDSVSKNLSMSVTDNVYGVIDLNYTIDLRDVLPEWVIFGFSAATGVRFEKIRVTSWSFNSSNLRVDDKKTEPPATSQHPVKEKGKNAGHKMGLIAGLVIIVVVFIALVVFYYLWRRRNKHIRDEAGYHAKMNKDFEQGTGPKRFSYQEVFL